MREAHGAELHGGRVRQILAQQPAAGRQPRDGGLQLLLACVAPLARVRRLLLRAAPPQASEGEGERRVCGER